MIETPKNLLPYDGVALYYGKIFSAQEITNYVSDLQTLDWQHDVVKMFGKTITTKRKVAWYGSQPFQYNYSQMSKVALPFTDALLQLKTEIETITKETYNSCLANYYHNGNEGMSWHKDNEKELKKHGAIASVSFGTSRKFSFKHSDTKEKLDLQLENGSLLVMKGAIQDFWLHQLPKTTKVDSPRINLTFRTIA